MSKLTPDSKFSDALTKYLEYCEVERNLSQNTIKMYHFYLDDFVHWAEMFLDKEEVTLSDINADMVKKYRIDLNRRISTKSNLEFKRSTQKTFLVGLRAFLKYLIVEEDVHVMSPEQITLGKSEDRVPKFLNDEQALTILLPIKAGTGLRE